MRALSRALKYESESVGDGGVRFSNAGVGSNFVAVAAGAPIIATITRALADVLVSVLSS